MLIVLTFPLIPNQPGLADGIKDVGYSATS